MKSQLLTVLLLAGAMHGACYAGAATTARDVRSAAGGAASAEGDGDCCIAHATTGCADNAIEACVCALDPFCCTVEWDSQCVVRVEKFGCGVCDLPACCAAKTVPGCEDPFIEACVCALDSFCCNEEWDAICAGEVTEFGCGACSGTLVHDSCAAAIDINVDGSRLFTTSVATTDGPALPATCNEGDGLSFVNDVWYCYMPQCGGLVTASTCISLYDTRVAVYDGCACPPTNDRLLACNDDFCSDQSALTFMTEPGEGYLIRVGGPSGSGIGLLTITGGGTDNTDDCNDNTVLDGCEVINDPGADCDSNRVPDECDIELGRSVVLQLPDRANGLLTDADCDQCNGFQQSIAEQFVLTQTRTIEKIRLWGGYAPGDTPGASDHFTVVFHGSAGGLPTAAISTQQNVPTVRMQTGTILFGVHEWEFMLTLANPVALNPGTYFVELFNDTFPNTASFFWETGKTDVVNGLVGHAFAPEAPGFTWTFDSSRGLAVQLLATSPVDCDADHVPDECDPVVAETPGDLDADCDVDLQDYALFTLCDTGPGVIHPPGCAPVDFDNDLDVDLRDWGGLQAVFETP